MAGYNVKTPALFGVKDPAQLVQFNLNTLNANISFPEGNSLGPAVITSDAPLTSQELLSGYIRVTAAIGYQTVPAVDLINGLAQKLLALSNKSDIRVGVNYECLLENASGGGITVNGVPVANGDVAIIRVIVTNFVFDSNLGTYTSGSVVVKVQV